MSRNLPRSSVMSRAQKLLQDDSILSSPEIAKKRTSSTRKKSKGRREDVSLSQIVNPRFSLKSEDQTRDSMRTNTSFVARKQQQQKADRHNKTFAIDTEHRNAHTRNRSFDGRPSVSSAHRIKELSKPPSCQSEKDLLRNHVSDLQQTVVKQGKKLKSMYKKIMGKRKEINQLTEQMYGGSKHKTRDLMELEEKVRGLEENELTLMVHLKEQRKVAKEALKKLYQLQDESVEEIEKAKKYYKEFYQRQANDQSYHSDYYTRKHEEDDQEKQKLLEVIRGLEAAMEYERNNDKSKSLMNEIAILKTQVREKALENERLKFENKELKFSLDESKTTYSSENLELKETIATLQEKVQMLKLNEEKQNQKESRNTVELKTTLTNLKQQLLDKENLIYENDKAYRDQLAEINQKVFTLQEELSRMGEYEERISHLQKELYIKEEELEMAKNYFQEKLNNAKAHQKQQKHEWNNIYQELLVEIKQLKSEIDGLALENKKLMSSIRAKNRDYY